MKPDSLSSLKAGSHDPIFTQIQGERHSFYGNSFIFIVSFEVKANSFLAFVYLWIQMFHMDADKNV